ncbi:hypothetical protein WG66_010256 [Moniliophthora roreri]|nr:hypothetical protein WG66_010256 [Moniliophthora roreri]
MTRKKTSTSSSRPLHIGNSQSQSNQTKVSGNGKRTRDEQATSDLEERSTSQKTEKRAKVTKSHKDSCNDGKLSRFLGDLPMDLWTVLCVVLPEPVPVKSDYSYSKILGYLPMESLCTMLQVNRLIRRTLLSPDLAVVWSAARMLRDAPEPPPAMSMYDEIYHYIRSLEKGIPRVRIILDDVTGPCRRHAEQIVDKCGKGDFDSEKHKEELEASSDFAVRCKMWEKSERRQRSLMKWHMHNERAEVIKDRLINLGYPEADTKAVWRMRSIINQKSPPTDRKLLNHPNGACCQIFRHFCWSLPLHLRLLGAPDDHDITQAALEEAVNSQQLQIDIHRAVVQKLTTTIEQYRPDIVVNASRIGANPFEMAEIAFLCRICHVRVPTLSGAIRHMGSDEWRFAGHGENALRISVNVYHEREIRFCTQLGGEYTVYQRAFEFQVLENKDEWVDDKKVWACNHCVAHAEELATRIDVVHRTWCTQAKSANRFSLCWVGETAELPRIKSDVASERV